MEWVCIVLFFIILIIFLIVSSYKSFDVTKYDIKSNKIDKNMKFIFLSDLHNRDIKDKLKELIDFEHPDFIVLGGDMIDSYPERYKNFMDLVKFLKDYKVYYTFGNHESRIDSVNKNRFYKKILKSNMIILNNSKVKLSRNINLYGFEANIDNFERHKNNVLNIDELNDKFSELNKDRFNLVLAHNPLFMKTYKKFGFDLILSGHVHGGLFRLPILGGLLSPEVKFFPEFDRGLYKDGKTKMIVSAGLGFSHIIPFRILNNPEIVIVNLTKE